MESQVSDKETMWSRKNIKQSDICIRRRYSEACEDLLNVYCISQSENCSRLVLKKSIKQIRSSAFIFRFSSLDI